MKKIIFSIIVLFLWSSVGQAANGNFTDIDGHWAKANIEFMTNKGYIGGYPDKTFKPNGTITRAEFSKILAAILNVSSDAISFNDTKNHWARESIEGLAKQGIIEAGVYGKTFNPNKAITRIEMARIIANALAYSKESYLLALNDLNSEVILPFSDFNEMKEENLKYIAMVSGTKIINGYSNYSFKPHKTTTRAEATKIFHTFLEAINKEANEFKPLMGYVEIAKFGNNAETVTGVKMLNFNENPIIFNFSRRDVTIKKILVIDPKDKNSLFAPMFKNAYIPIGLKDNDYYIFAMLLSEKNKTDNKFDGSIIAFNMSGSLGVDPNDAKTFNYTRLHHTWVEPNETLTGYQLYTIDKSHVEYPYNKKDIKLPVRGREMPFYMQYKVNGSGTGETKTINLTR